MTHVTRKIILHLALAGFLLLTVFFVQFALATTYYVKPTGNDALSGHTLDSAWQHVQMACTTLVAGDTVLIRAGAYDEASPYSLGNINCGLRPKNSGIPGLPIVFKGYPGDVRPIIKGVIGERNMATLGGIDYITLDSLEFRSGYRGIFTSDSDSLVVKYCVIDSSRGPTGGNNNGGVTTFTGNAASIRWLTVYACSLFANGDDGSYTAGFNSSGVHLYGCTDCLFRKNVVYDESAGINFKGHTNEPSFYNCLVDSNVVYNINSHAFVAGSFGTQDSIVFRYNIAYNAVSGFLPNSMSDMPIRGATRFYVYNNTFDCGGYGAGLHAQYSVSFEKFNFFNNIIYNPYYNSDGGGNYTSAIAFKNANTYNECCEYPIEFYEDYNIMYGLSPGDKYYIWHPDADKTLAQWQAALPSGVVAGSAAHNTIENPLFVNAGNRDYHLQTGSPAATGGREGAWPTYRGAYAPPPSGPDVTPPTITSGPQATGITSSGATITWTTNESATTQVDYGLTTSYGSSTTLNSSLVTSHSQGLSALSAGTVYHYRVRSRDAAGNEAVSGDFTFTTSVADVTPPVISGVQASGITTTGATIIWTTNEPATSQVDYGLTTSYGSSTTLNASLVTAHSQSLSGLSSGTLYHYRVRSRDAAGNEAVSGDFTFTTSVADVTPPVISGVQASGITTTGATITWTTNESATTQVDYGLSTSYGSSTTLNSSLVTSHSQGLSALSAGTVYHYRVRSRDAAGNEAVSSDYTFTTTPASSNLALGVLPSVSGTYAGYAPASATDGSTISSWASDDSSTSPHWNEINFGSTKTVRRVVMRWAWNSFQSSWMTSQRYQIQSWNGTSFVDALVVSNPPVGSVTDVSFPAVSTSRIRIYQPAGMGPSTYTVILWVSEVEAYEAAGPDTIPPATVGDLNGR